MAYDEAVESLALSKAKEDANRTAKVTPEIVEIAEYKLDVVDIGPSQLDVSDVPYEYGEESGGDVSGLFKDAKDTEPIEMGRKDSKSSSKSKKIEESVAGDISFYFSKVPLL